LINVLFALFLLVVVV
jgi:ribosome assembly protein RRB1